VRPERLAILLLEGRHERAHYAFLLAAGAAALGREVILFASNSGCLALRASWRDDSGRDADIRARGVAGLIELRDASIQLGVRLMACEAGLRMAGLEPADLLPSCEIAGIATFLEAAGNAQIVSL
jgi:predicted peroxiredoxin